MAEERRPDDPTRRMLRVFGVTVSNYEEKTARLMASDLEELARGELIALAADATALTAELDRVLRETTGHVLATEERVLAQVKAALDRAGIIYGDEP
jgi:hypothetical protein